MRSNTSTAMAMLGVCGALAARGIPVPAPAGHRPYDRKPQSNRERKASEKAARKRAAAEAASGKGTTDA